MVTRLINGAIDAAMSAAWKPVRGVYDGLTGTSNWKNADGDKIARNPANKLAQRLKASSKQMITGKKYDPKTGQALEEQRGFLGRQTIGRVGGALHTVGDLTLGAAGTALGWGARTTAGLGMGAVAMAAPTVLKGTALVAGQGIKDTASIATGGARLLHNMSKSDTGSTLLFGGGLAATAGVAGASALFKDTTNSRVGFYSNHQVDSLPGTLAAQGAAEGSNAFVDTGADGDLVFALHNMR